MWEWTRTYTKKEIKWKKAMKRMNERKREKKLKFRSQPTHIEIAKTKAIKWVNFKANELIAVFIYT